MTDEPEDEGSKESKAKADEPAEAETKKADDKKADDKKADDKKADDKKADDKKADDKKAVDKKADVDKKAVDKKADDKKFVDKKSDGNVEEADIPPTRKHEAIEAAPPSELDFHAPITYPDDGPVSAQVRRIDNIIGMAEQVVLVTLLSLVVLTAASHALLDRFAQIHLSFKDDVIRAGTFAIAMIAGPFATHQAKHLSMDLISRKFSPRARLFLKVFLAAFVIFIVILLIRAGFHNIANEKQFASEDKLITRVRIAWLIPIGGFLIILHTVLHTIIDVDYILRKKTPPERMRSGH